MKKLLIFLLVCLMLASCAGQQEATDVTTELTVPPIVGLYDAENPIEKATNGAVRAYPLENNDGAAFLSMGDKLVVVSPNKLTVLQGDQCEVVAQLDVKVEYMCVSAAETGLAYYDESAREIVLLNPLLQKSKNYPLPEKLQGKPMINLPTQQAFYCDGQELRSLNLQTGISRLIRTFTEKSVELLDLYFEGEMLRCLVTAEDRRHTVYLSTQTGQTLSEDGNLFLQTYGESYFAVRQDGPVVQRIFGTRNGEAKSLNLDDALVDPIAALPLGGVVKMLQDETGLDLHFYDLTSGHKKASVRLEGITETGGLYADSRYFWLVVVEDGKQVLYRWDPSLSAVADEMVYTGPLYTYQNPDTEGLAALKKRVEEMNQTYGVRIAIWEDAMKTTGNYTFKPEHQVSAISERLDQLETVLSKFPKKFLRSTVEAGWIRICLVRSIESGEPYVQYWSGGDCYGAISMDAEITTAFLQCAAYGIDSHVMGNSRDFDTWNQLNPYGFSYGQEVNEKYLEGDSRAFVDAMAMSNPHEDRSRIIAYAMMEGNAEMFASSTMQAKLLRVCEGIREAYGLEKSTETYLWEQYLNTSLAYTK
ncbi:MAG: hypothetical protein IKK41_01655 [Oscillospiraceae bacterium]|nr:hypothetical protein [Oscillospiraceae bacterium]